MLPRFDTLAWVIELMSCWTESSSIIPPQLGKQWIFIGNLFLFSWATYNHNIAKLFTSIAVSLSVSKYDSVSECSIYFLSIQNFVEFHSLH
jgi:hypothetical protein